MSYIDSEIKIDIVNTNSEIQMGKIQYTYAIENKRVWQFGVRLIF